MEALSEARGFLWKTIRCGGITFLLEELRRSKRGKACMTYFLRFNMSKKTVGLIMVNVYPGI